MAPSQTLPAKRDDDSQEMEEEDSAVESLVVEFPDEITVLYSVCFVEPTKNNVAGQHKKAGIRSLASLMLLNVASVSYGAAGGE